MRSLALLSLVLVLVGCSGSAPVSGSNPGGALLDVWAGLDEAFAALAGREPEVCDGPFGTWFTDFGTRGLTCAAAQVVAPTSFLARAPVAPFQRGPHTATAEAVRLDLNDPRSFGHYDPAFVRWFVTHAIPDADDATARTLTQLIYGRRVRRLARVYWLALGDLEAGGFPETVPAGPLADYAAFLNGGPVPGDVYSPDGGYSVFAFTERSETLLPRVGIDFANDWTAKYEANTAYGFWLRRRADATWQQWHDGLRRLLQAYDSAWLNEP